MKEPFFSHGTRCAGEVAGARDNGVCGVGVAYDSMVAGKKNIFICDAIGTEKRGLDILQNPLPPSPASTFFCHEIV